MRPEPSVSGSTILFAVSSAGPRLTLYQITVPVLAIAIVAILAFACQFVRGTT